MRSRCLLSVVECVMKLLLTQEVWCVGRAPVVEVVSVVVVRVGVAAVAIHGGTAPRSCLGESRLDVRGDPCACTHPAAASHEGGSAGQLGAAIRSCTGTRPFGARTARTSTQDTKSRDSGDMYSPSMERTPNSAQGLHETEAVRIARYQLGHVVKCGVAGGSDNEPNRRHRGREVRAEFLGAESEYAAMLCVGNARRVYVCAYVYASRCLGGCSACATVRVCAVVCCCAYLCVRLLH